VTKLLQAARLSTPTGFRDRTLFEVLYSTGLRGGELCKLTLYEVNLQERMLRVIEGKGRKDRVVPVGKVAASYLAEYIRAVRPILLGDQQTPAVFVTARGAPFKTNNLRQQFILHRDRAGLPDIITVHSLRHTCATEMLKGGASIRHVQELLGHASISTTQIYTHVVQTDLKKAHARTAPSERRQAVDVPSFDTVAPSWNDNRNAKYWAIIHGKMAMKKSGKPNEPGEKNSKTDAAN
jgi:integrase/recombinase XerD